MLQSAEALYGLDPGAREDQDTEAGVGLLGVWLVMGAVFGLGLLVVVLGVLAGRLPPGALLGAWLLANGLLGLLTLLSALLPTPPRPRDERHPGAMPAGMTVSQHARR